MDNDLTLIIGSRSLSGWTEMAITRSMEHCPSTFSIGMTELSPIEGQAIQIRPGDACQVMIDSDLVITGYVDSFAPSVLPNDHTIKVSGRGKCQDLIDCSAEWPGGQIVGNTALGIAKKLASVYGAPDNRIEVVLTDGTDVGAAIPVLTINHDETPWEVIERVCRYRALLAYEDPNGNLVLAGSPGTENSRDAASGFRQGSNVLSASAVFSMNQRFSDYVGYELSLDPLLELGDAGNLFTVVNDKSVTRHRMKAVIAETTGYGAALEIAKKRVIWERNVRWGRSHDLHITTDGWRDSAGKLWEPNTLVPLSLPSLHIDQKQWLISEVTYKRDNAGGTTCDLVIRPPEAFEVEPINLFPTLLDFEQAMGK